MDITKISNMKPVEEFVSYIRNRVQGANRNWIEIAQAFAEAEEMYGTASERFKQLREQTDFSRSKITKLLAIVSSERLKKYAVQLSSVQSWGTLYAIESLTDEQFNKLKEQYKFDNLLTVAPFISQTNVDKIRKGAVERSLFRGYVTIQVDEEAVKGGLLSGAEFEELERLLAKVEQVSSYVKMKRSDVDEKEQVSWLNRVSEKVKQVVRRHYLEAINATLERHKKQKGEAQLSFEARCLGRSKSELMGDLQADAEEAFKWIGAHYDVATFYNEAEDDVNKTDRAKMTKYARKVLERPADIKELAYDEAAAMAEADKQFSEKRGTQEATKEKLRAMFDKAA